MIIRVRLSVNINADVSVVVKFIVVLLYFSLFQTDCHTLTNPKTENKEKQKR